MVWCMHTIPSTSNTQLLDTSTSSSSSSSSSQTSSSLIVRVAGLEVTSNVLQKPLLVLTLNPYQPSTLSCAPSGLLH